MILIISNTANTSAAALVGMFPAGVARLVTASQFHKSLKVGIAVNDFASSSIAIDGTAVPAGEIRGVVTTLTHFLPEEFQHVGPEDRGYVCAELNAFFLYFLSALACKKMNPPSRRTLTGLGMHPIEWLTTARALNIPAWPVLLKNGVAATQEDSGRIERRTCTVIAGKARGEGLSERMIEDTSLLARVYSLSYLSCSYASRDGGDFLLTDLASVVDLEPSANRTAVVDYFLEAG